MSPNLQEHPGEPRHRKYSTEEKYQAVLRILAGEDPVRLATELQVTVDRVRAWRDGFVMAGRQALAERAYHHSRKSHLLQRLEQLQKETAPWAALLASLALIMWMLTRYLATTTEP